MGINVGQRGLAETGMVESDPNELRGGGGYSGWAVLHHTQDRARDILIVRIYTLYCYTRH